MSVTVAHSSDAKDLGEGPHWDSSTNQILYIGMFNGEFHRLDVETKTDEVFRVDGTVSFIIPTEDGGYVAGNDLKIIKFDWTGGKITTLAQIDDPAVKFNDAKCDAKGRLWVGTLGKPVERKFPEKLGALYSLDNRGLVKHVSEVGLSNGLAFSGDNSTLYHVDSLLKSVFTFDFDLENGTLGNRRLVKDFTGYASLDFVMPDGMTIDAEDKLWVAVIPHGSVVRLDPNSGEILHSVKFSISQITSCCFGGRDLSDLYVTSGRYSLTEEQEKAQPDAGSLMKVTGLGVKGLPAYIYKG